MVSALQPGQQRGLGHCGLSLAPGGRGVFCMHVTQQHRQGLERRMLKYKTLKTKGMGFIQHAPSPGLFSVSANVTCLLPLSIPSVLSSLQSCLRVNLT